MNYQIHIDEAGEGEEGYTAYVDEIPGAISQGESVADALRNLADAIDDAIDELLAIH